MLRDKAVVVQTLAITMALVPIAGVPPVGAEEDPCPDEPLAGVPGAAGRRLLVAPCVTVTGTAAVADIVDGLDVADRQLPPGGSAGSYNMW